MVSTSPQPTTTATQAALQETLLTPRFYTTNFEVAAALDLSSQEVELQAMLDEMRADYNRHHFVRDDSFQTSWDHITGEARQAFVDYLSRSCVSEFSGFLLFKELSRRLKKDSPKLSEMFQLMARDEARHAGFLNKAMADFNQTLDLGFLTHERTYTFFPIEWVIYTVYLSEKIGYWRYILIHRHLKQNPENQFYPLFKYFEPWCQDENRHGDIFKVLLRSQQGMWQGWQARFWSRFFLLSVFATHTLTVHERTNFYKSLGLNATQFDEDVVRNTNATAGRTFPTILDVDHPEFFTRLHQCSDLNLKMSEIDQTSQPGWLKSLQKFSLKLGIVGHLLRLLLLPTIDAEATRGTVC